MATDTKTEPKVETKAEEAKRLEAEKKSAADERKKAAEENKKAYEASQKAVVNPLSAPVRPVPILVVDDNDVELFSGEFIPLEGRNPILVTSSIGTAVHQFDANTPLVKVVIPTIDPLTDYTPPDPPILLEAQTESEGLDLDNEKESKKK